MGQCVCQWVNKLTSTLEVIILQDPKEAKHAKNTVTLLNLGLSNVRCISIQSMDDVRSLLMSLDRNEWKLVFPCEKSMAIEALDHSQRSSVKGIILLDATWRKAKKLYLLEPLLQRFPTVHFSEAPEGEYVIRKSPDSYTLSTLEACAYSIEEITGEDMQPLREFMIKAQEWQWRKQPKQHQHDKVLDGIERS